MKKYLFPTLIAFSALAVSATAAFYSVTGLSKLFIGASFAVIIMAASLELAKLVIASYLYQYWSKTNVLLKIYLTIAVFVLILITSAGIYGFLSSAYEQTASKNIVVEKRIAALESKKVRYLETKESYSKEKVETAKSTSELRQALSIGSITQYKDKETGQILNVANSGNRKAFEKQLENTLKKDSTLDVKINTVSDSVFSLESQILEFQSKAETSGELGPLKYISKLLDIPMDRIINWFILVIIFVFDPLAVSLIIAANNAFNKAKMPQQLAMYNEAAPFEVKPIEIKSVVVEPVVVLPPPQKSWRQFIYPIFKSNKKEEDDIKTY